MKKNRVVPSVPTPRSSVVVDARNKCLSRVSSMVDRIWGISKDNYDLRFTKRFALSSTLGGVSAFGIFTVVYFVYGYVKLGMMEFLWSGLVGAVFIGLFILDLALFRIHQNVHVTFWIGAILLFVMNAASYVVAGGGVNVPWIVFCLTNATLCVFWRIRFHGLLVLLVFVGVFGLLLSDVIRLPTVLDSRLSYMTRMIATIASFGIVVVNVLVSVRQARENASLVEAVATSIETLEFETEAVTSLRSLPRQQCSDIMLLLRRIVRWMKLYRSYLPGSLRSEGLTGALSQSITNSDVYHSQHSHSLSHSLPTADADSSEGDSTSQVDDDSTDTTSDCYSVDNPADIRQFSSTLADAKHVMDDGDLRVAVAASAFFVQRRQATYFTLRSSISRSLLPQLSPQFDALFVELMRHLVRIVNDAIVGTGGELIAVDCRDGQLSAAWNVVTKCVDHVIAGANAMNAIRRRVETSEVLNRIRERMNHGLCFECVLTTGEAVFGNVGCESFRRMIVMGSVVEKNDLIQKEVAQMCGGIRQERNDDDDGSTSSCHSSFNCVVGMTAVESLKFIYKVIPCALVDNVVIKKKRTNTEEEEDEEERFEEPKSLIYELGARVFTDVDPDRVEWLYSIPTRFLESPSTDNIQKETWVETFETCWMEIAVNNVEEAKKIFEEFVETRSDGDGDDGLGEEERRGMMRLGHVLLGKSNAHHDEQ